MNTILIALGLLFPIFKLNPTAIGPGNQGYDARSDAESSDRRRREEYHIAPSPSPTKDRPITIQTTGPE